MIEVAWLKYYTQKMDKYLLAREILLDSGIEVGLPWKIFYLGKRYLGRKIIIKSNACGDKRYMSPTELYHPFK